MSTTQRPSSRTVTTTTTTTTHYWGPHRRAAIAPLLGAVGLVALGIGQLLPLRHGVEDTLTTNSSKALAAAGLSGVSVSFTGQDGTLTGTGLTPEQQQQALDIVRKVDGVRVATFSGGSATPSASPSVTASATQTASQTPSQTPTATATLNLPSANAKLAGGAVTLTGSVPTEDARKALVAAATTTFGAGHVVDQLTVDAGVSDDGLSGFAGLFPALGKNATATADLAQGVLTLTGAVASADARTKIDAAAAAVVGDPSKVSDKLTVAATPNLQSQLAALGQITFDTASSTLTPQGDVIVSRAAAVLRANPRIKVRIEGNTDDQGDAPVNQELSTARAQTVLLTLGFRGVDKSRLTAVGYGETRPKVANDTPAHRAQNRRVEFVVLP
jgi:OmpA-OmpF porin, OOP family